MIGPRGAHGGRPRARLAAGAVPDSGDGGALTSRGVFLETYGVALATIFAAGTLGRAICLASGVADAWASPMVGLAGLIIITGAAIKLPGRAVTADVIGLLVVAASL